MSYKRQSQYWKLGFDTNYTAREAVQYLEDHGYRCRLNAGKKFVMDAVGRCQRGLLSYEHLNIDELQSFCRPRRISSKAATVLGLARALEKADDAATFTRFFDLPPEIRVLIYELHYQDFDHLTTRHRQPPLTLTSRQLRVEALPLFYECAKFDIFMEQIDVNYAWGQNQPEWRTSLDEDEKLLTLMPAANFARIKTLHLHWALRKEGINIEISTKFTVHDGTNGMAKVAGTSSKARSQSLADAIKAAVVQNFGDIHERSRPSGTSAPVLSMVISGALFDGEFEVDEYVCGIRAPFKRMAHLGLITQ